MKNQFEGRLAIASLTPDPGARFELLRRIRLRLRRTLNIEQTAALNRAERLFEVNFRNTWTR